MNRAARIPCAVAWALLAGCETGAGPTSEIGTATFSGAQTGTAPAYALGAYTNELSLDGRYHLSFNIVTTPTAVLPSLVCGLMLPGTSLQVGIFTPANAIGYSCSMLYESDGGVPEEWAAWNGNGSPFELDISSTGPSAPGTDGVGTTWQYASATLTVALLPSNIPSPYDAGVSILALVGPH